MGLYSQIIESVDFVRKSAQNPRFLLLGNDFEKQDGIGCFSKSRI